MFRDPIVYDFHDFPPFSQRTKKDSAMFKNSIESPLPSLERL